MNQREEIIKTLRTSYNFLSSEFSVKKIAVFGSAAKNTMTPGSDIDIVVEFNSPIGFRFNRLVEYLENLLGRKVDILTKDGISNIRVKKITESIERDMIYV
ncbi:nucleotidyltransferase family protein [bacterium]|nr:nucleotidyltransferase family protein [bacterium]